MIEKVDLVFKEECYEIIGSCMRVHSDKGNGFHQPIYQECLEIDFEIEAFLLSHRQRLRWRIVGEN